MTASWALAVYPLADTSTGWAPTRPEAGVTFTSGAAPAGGATSPDVTAVAMIAKPTTMDRLTFPPLSRRAQNHDQYAAPGLARVGSKTHEAARRFRPVGEVRRRTRVSINRLRLSRRRIVGTPRHTRPLARVLSAVLLVAAGCGGGSKPPAEGIHKIRHVI